MREGFLYSSHGIKLGSGGSPTIAASAELRVTNISSNMLIREDYRLLHR